MTRVTDVWIGNAASGTDAHLVRGAPRIESEIVDFHQTCTLLTQRS